MAGTSTQRSQATSSGGSYFGNDITSLLQSLQGPASFAGANYANYLSNPTASPLFQAQLGPLMQSLVPAENRARTALTDQFRAAGGLRSGAYGREGTMLEGELMGRRQQAAGNLLGQSFGQMTQALNSPLNQVSSLINALKLNQQSSQSSSSGGSNVTDPVQQQSSGSQGSGLTAGSLLQALTGLMKGGTQGGTWQGTTSAPVGGYDSYGYSDGNQGGGLLGYGQAYDQWGMPDNGTTVYDQWGYTPEDWANDPYYN